jgi:hypothetical protein
LIVDWVWWWWFVLAFWFYLGWPLFIFDFGKRYCKSLVMTALSFDVVSKLAYSNKRRRIE